MQTGPYGLHFTQLFTRSIYKDISTFNPTVNSDGFLHKLQIQSVYKNSHSRRYTNVVFTSGRSHDIHIMCIFYVAML